MSIHSMVKISIIVETHYSFIERKSFFWLIWLIFVRWLMMKIWVKMSDLIKRIFYDRKLFEIKYLRGRNLSKKISMQNVDVVLLFNENVKSKKMSSTFISTWWQIHLFFFSLPTWFGFFQLKVVNIVTHDH
jgi:hypothetical protein